MNYKKVVFPAFILLVLIQLFVPASMILQQEDIITTGKAFKFKTAPFDPYDPFRGKYIRLSFDNNSIEVPEDSEWAYGETVYVSLTTDEEGYAKIQAVSKSAPTDDSDYLKAKVRRFRKRSTSQLFIQYPFDRFYMEESKAYGAEQMYRESQRDTSQITYALVKVKNGASVLEDVLINDVPIKEVVEQGRE